MTRRPKWLLVLVLLVAGLSFLGFLLWVALLALYEATGDACYREFCVKLSKVRDRILTPEGRRIAAERHNFMEAFFSRFLEEYDGLK